MMMRVQLFIMVLAGFLPACSQSSSTPEAQPVAAGQAASSATSASTEHVHFFSVAWGCIEVEKSKLDAASYTIQDFETKTGACPSSLTVLNTNSQKLLECPVVIGPKAIPATYILFDKRSIDGKTVSDLRAEGFTTDNFCPALAQRSFK